MRFSAPTGKYRLRPSGVIASDRVRVGPSTIAGVFGVSRPASSMSNCDMPPPPEWFTYACLPSGATSYCETVSGSPRLTTYRLRPSGAAVTPHGPLPAGTIGVAFGVGAPAAERSYALTPSRPVAYRLR